MNIINHPVEVNRVRIINQILDIVCLLANFHPNSLDFIRQLQRWIGGIDWWRWLVKCQKHSKTSGHQIDTEDVIIIDREERWFERGVREAIWERVEKPSLNKRRGLRFQWPICFPGLECHFVLFLYLEKWPYLAFRLATFISYSD